VRHVPNWGLGHSWVSTSALAVRTLTPVRLTDPVAVCGIGTSRGLRTAILGGAVENEYERLVFNLNGGFWILAAEPKPRSRRRTGSRNRGRALDTIGRRIPLKQQPHELLATLRR